MDKSNILNSIKNLQNEVDQIKKKSNTIETKIYYSFDRHLEDELDALEEYEENLRSKIEMYLNKLENPTYK